MAYKNNQQLATDETMSPTLEAAIVLWALERIDSRLPRKVKKNYGHQMVGDQCLVSLQPTIFQNIPNMLAELESGEEIMAARCRVQAGECNQLFIRKKEKVPKSFSKRRYPTNTSN